VWLWECFAFFAVLCWGYHMHNRYQYRRLLLRVIILLCAVTGIAKQAPAQTFTEFPIPTAGISLGGITAGPDGALWFAEASTSKIGRITTAGVVTEFPTPTTGSPLVFWH
jgi:streptogramin lyase